MSLAGFLVVLVGWVHYLWLIPQERVPARPRAHQLAMVVGSVAALLGVHTLGTAILAANAVAFGAFFLWLLTQAPMPDGTLVAEVGAVLPGFEALDHEGKPRSIEEWRGRPLLLKFFRGHW